MHRYWKAVYCMFIYETDCLFFIIDHQFYFALTYNSEFYQFLHSTIFTSIFGIITLHSLFLFLVLKGRVFLHYFIMILGLTVHTSLALFNTQLLLTDMISVISAMIAVLGSVLFTQSFIGLGKEQYQGWTKVFIVLKGSTLLVILLQLFNIIFLLSIPFSDGLSFVAAFLALLVVCVNFFASISLWNKERMARLYLKINLLMILSSIGYIVIWLLRETDQIESMEYSAFVISGGMSVQMILFASFVGFKVKSAEKEKLEVEQNANKKLVIEVEKQTKSLKASKEKAEDQQVKLKELNDLKNKLFSLVAHDLRNPLNHLTGVVELLERDAIDEDKKVEITRKTKIELSESITVIDRLLQWSYKQLDGIQVEPSRLSINEVVSEVVTELKANTSEKKIEIKKSLEVDDILFDRDMLRVVFRNLLSNAIKFSPEKSEVLIFSKTIDDSVVLGIKDHGLGMNPEWYEELMEKGKPEVKVGTKGEKGKGFGLLITKDFVEMNDGVLECESSLGKGTTFTLRLPA